jgi:curved DNA-binding protein
VNYQDYYKIMGVDKTATQDEIKKAYRKLARKYHPDVSKEKDAEQRFKEIGEAYEVLRDKEKRAAYDQLGSNWKAGQGFTPPPNWQEQFKQGNGNYSHNAQGDFSDFFESLFGGGFNTSQHRARHHQQSRGQDSHAKIAIELEDSYKGATRSFTLQDQVVNEYGQMQIKERTLKVKIPKGIKAGQKIRLQKQGESIGGGIKGDLYLEVNFKPNALFEVDGANVTTEISIAPWQAALGDKIKVPTPSGDVDLTLPKLVSSGSKMRLKGRGLPGKVAGDFYVKLKIVMPKTLSAEEESLYQSLKNLAIGEPDKPEQKKCA